MEDPVKDERLEECRKQIKTCFQALFAKERWSYMGNFIQGLIHNMNGPLQNMSMLVELIAVGHDKCTEIARSQSPHVADTLEDSHEKMCQRIEQMSSQVSILIQILRDFMILNELQRNDSEVDVNLIIVKLLQALRSDLFFKHHVELELRLTEHLPLVRVLARHLIPSLVHLFQNAMIAMRASEEKKLILATRWQGDAIVLEFRDSGCGFTPKVAARLFAPFYTAWPASVAHQEKDEEHYGLGLFTVRSLLEPYGVSVNLLRVGEETVAEVKVPVERA
jgi:signal transduction histidine kinase